jgi:hypothetical protein
VTSSDSTVSSEFNQSAVYGACMHQLLPILLVLLGSKPTTQSTAPERHLGEAGSSVIFLRSAFAHGYRHGYEEGYHVGNMDINMGRQPRTRMSQFHGISTGYAPGFGPRGSFDSGFVDGLKAGYIDGFAGRLFRAVDIFREVSISLSESPAAADPANIYFNQGFSAGYQDGLLRSERAGASPASFDPISGSCGQFHPARAMEQPVQQSFCEGYWRGHNVGNADALALGPEHHSMQASK